MINISKYIDFIVDNKLSQTQFTFLYMIYYSTIDREETTRLVKKYKKRINADALISIDELNGLVEMGFIQLADNKDQFNSVTLTDKFLKILIDEEGAAWQVFELYPAFNKDEKSGAMFTLKSYEFEMFKRRYGKAINYSYDEHLEVMKDLKYGIRFNMIKLRIEIFVKSRGWLDIRKERIKFGTEKKQATVNHSTDL